MPRFLTYACPADYHAPSVWYQFRTGVAGLLEAAHADWSVSVDDSPFFVYGIDAASTLGRVNAIRPRPNEIILAQWSAIVAYPASVVFLGNDVRAEQVRAALRSQTLLREHVGEFSLATARCVGYGLHPGEASEANAIDALVTSVTDRVYVGPDWYVNDGDGRVDSHRFEVIGRGGRSFAAFAVRDGTADRDLWSRARDGDGLAIVGADDPLLSGIARFEETPNELELFLRDGLPARPRVTIGRCHVDDSIVALYDSAVPSDGRIMFAA